MQTMSLMRLPKKFLNPNPNLCPMAPTQGEEAESQLLRNSASVQILTLLTEILSM